MKSILQQIANTIVANLDNTSQLGLCNGKMGLCCYLFAYSDKYESDTHQQIAYDLLREILFELSNNIERVSIDALSEVGIGLVMLLKQDLISDSDEGFLTRIDKLVLKNVYTIERMLALSHCNNIFLPGLYLLFRIRDFNKGVDASTANLYVSNVYKQLIKNEDITITRDFIAFWFSVLFCITKLSELHCLAESQTVLHKAQTMLANVINTHINSIHIPSEALLFIQDNLNERIDAECNRANFSYDYDHRLWSYILHDCYEAENAFLADGYESYVKNKIQNMFYSIMATNSQLAATGLLLLENSN